MSDETPKWTSVDHALPSPDEEVLGYFGPHGPVVGTLPGGGPTRNPPVLWFLDGHGYWIDGCTHWMPLPEPPKGASDDH